MTFWKQKINSDSVSLLAYIPFLFVAVYNFISCIPHLNEFPSYTHAWSQSDRYALALGFIKNNFNFFHPQTFHYNKQFPGTWLYENASPITSVDFPIHEYIVAIFMKIFSTTDVWVFKTYTLLFCTLGLFFLYRLILESSKNVLYATFTIVFITISPLFFYYQSRLIPSMFALSSLFIGLYYLYLYWSKKQHKKYIPGIIFLTLAALVRKPYVLFLGGVFLVEIIQIIRTRAFNWKHWLGNTICLLVIVGYFLYNLYLRSKYGSIFLGNVVPLDSVFETIAVWKTLARHHYFTVYHYIIITAIVFIILTYRIIAKREIWKKLELYLLLCFFMVCTYFFIMTKQFIDHDYYLLDSFFPIVILLIISFIVSNMVPKWVKAFSIFVFSFLLIKAIPLNNKSYKERRLSPSSISTDFEGAEAFIDELKIAKNARFYFLGSCAAPNMGLLKLNRFGLTNMWIKDYVMIDQLKNWHYDYIVVQNDILVSEAIPENPQIMSHMNYLGTNGKILVFTKPKIPSPKNIETLLEIKEENLIISMKLNPKNSNASYWNGYAITNTTEFGEVVWNKSELYAPNLTFEPSNDYMIDPYIMVLEGEILSPKPIDFRELFLIFSSKMNGEEIIKSFRLSNILDKQQKRNSLYVPVYFTWPLKQGNKNEFYIHNPKNQEFYCKDFKMSFFKCVPNNTVSSSHP